MDRHVRRRTDGNRKDFSAGIPPSPLYSKFDLGAKGELLVLHLFEDASGKLAIPVRFGRIAGSLDNGEKMAVADGVLHLSGLKPMSALVLLLR